MKTENTSSRALVEQALARACAPEGEGRLVFTRLDADRARRTADAVDAMRGAGIELSPIAGLPISVKDLFDMAGEVTTAGSVFLRSHPPAAADAAVITRLKRAGAVILGRTNMTEFAFTGVGINPHYGTPANPYQRERRLLPGGSSSGAAVSVSDGMASAAIGSDTGGSIRIPAALCGLTGFKPTQCRVPLAGVFPLSQTLDSVGAIARTVTECAALDAVMAGEEPWKPSATDLSLKTFAVPKNFFLDDLDAQVGKAFESVLSKIPGKIVEVEFPEIAEIKEINANGGFAAAEAYAFHRRLGTGFAQCDPLVSERILRGKEISAADYIEMVERRGAVIQAFNRAHAEYDAILAPTVPVVAPEIAALERSTDEFRRVNLLLLRNPAAVNFLDRCALSLPCQPPGDAPVGLMLIGRHLEDHELLSIGLAIEHLTL